MAEIIQRDIEKLREGDAILIEVAFSHIYNGDLVALYKTTPFRENGNEWIPLSTKPEKYYGVPMRPIARGSQFKSSLTGSIVEVHLVRMGTYFCFFEIDPSKTIVLDDQAIRAANWERIK